MSDKGSINNITLPVSKRLAKDIKDAIQADKDILSQLVYDEQTKTLAFPKNILPLSIRIDDDTYYFDYYNLALLHDDGTETGNDLDVQSNGVLSIVDVNETIISDITKVQALEYISRSEKPLHFDTILNTYKLYHPTTLFKHIIRYQAENDDFFRIELLTERQLPFTPQDFVVKNGMGVGFNFILLTAYDETDSGELSNGFKLIEWDFNNDIYRIVGVAINGTISSLSVASSLYNNDFTDSVTTL